MYNLEWPKCTSLMSEKPWIIDNKFLDNYNYCIAKRVGTYRKLYSNCIPHIENCIATVYLI